MDDFSCVDSVEERNLHTIVVVFQRKLDEAHERVSSFVPSGTRHGARVVDQELGIVFSESTGRVSLK